MKKKLFVLSLVLVLAMSINLTAFAATENAGSFNQNETVCDNVSPRGVYGYAAHDAHSSSGSFKVYAPGTSAVTGGVTFKTAYFQEGTPIYMSLQRPDGSFAVTDVLVTGNSEVSKNYLKSIPGYYTIYYSIYGTSNGQLSGWVF